MYNLPSLATLGWLILVFFVLWVVISLPIYIASRVMVSRRKATLGRAIITTFIAIIAFILLASIFGLIFPFLGLLMGFLGILAVLRVMYDIGWVYAFVMAIVAFIFIIVISTILALLGLALSSFNAAAHFPSTVASVLALTNFQYPGGP